MIYRDETRCLACWERRPVEALTKDGLCVGCERRVALFELEQVATVLGDAHELTQLARERARRAEGL